MKKPYLHTLPPRVTRDRSFSYLAGRVRGAVPALKSDTDTSFTSADLRDYLFVLEVDPTVIKYWVRTETTAFSIAGEVTKHTFAAKVEYIGNRTELHDIRQDHLAEEYVAAVSALQLHFPHRWVRPGDYRTGRRWENVVRLMQARGPTLVPPQFPLRLLSVLRPEPTPLRKVFHALSDIENVEQLVLRAMATGGIGFDLDEEIGPDMAIWMGRTG